MPLYVSEHSIELTCDCCGCSQEFLGSTTDGINQAVAEGWKSVSESGKVYCPACAADRHH
jgi:hypothetical protein